MLILDCSNGILTLKFFLSPHPRNLTVKDYKASSMSHSQAAKHPLQLPLPKCYLKRSGPRDVKPYDSVITQAQLFVDMAHNCPRNHSI